MIQHLIVLPVVLPLVAGILLLYQRQGLVHYKRIVSVLASILLLLVSIALVRQAASGEINLLRTGRLAATVWRGAGTRPPLSPDGTAHLCARHWCRGICLRWR